MTASEHEAAQLQESEKFLGPSDEGYIAAPQQGIRTSLLFGSILGLSIALNFTLPVLLYQYAWFEGAPAGSEYLALTETFSGVNRRFWRRSDYSSDNKSLQDALWDEINPYHGMVAFDTHQAKSWNWAESMTHPEDAGKTVYFLEGYHQLHCLKILRDTLHKFGDDSDVEHQRQMIPHLDHCLDYFRQVTICNASPFPLWTFEDVRVDTGQVHQCRDWNELRRYATENSACYIDVLPDPPMPLEERFRYCDDGTDGVALA